MKEINTSKLLKIAKIGDLGLRNKAKPVIEAINSEILELIDSLIVTAAANKGVGIAAPQVSRSYRLFIMASHPSDRYPHAPTMSPTAIINPRILNHGSEIVKDWEGCLSVPNVRGLVPRYREIEVEYTTVEGQAFPALQRSSDPADLQSAKERAAMQGLRLTPFRGESKQEILTDFLARIFQHELDHLDGILFVDRVEDREDLYTEAEYQNILSKTIELNH